MTNRGYTGHEHLNEVGLIHMNGRVFDPLIARFISADRIIQAPNDMQSYNRYAYVRNNPLKYTDPSGFSWRSKNVTDKFRSFRKNVSKAWRENWKTIVAVGLAVWGGWAVYSSMTLLTTPGTMLAIQAGTAAGATSGAIMGATATALNGGNLREVISAGLTGGAQGAVSGALFGGVSAYYGNTWSIGRVAANGVAGGISSEVSGGEFRDGFKTNFGLSLLTYGNFLMRKAMIKQSQLNPHNIGKDSGGFFGDEVGIGGTRRVVDPNATPGSFPYLKCDGPAGGCQGPLLSTDIVGTTFESSRLGPFSYKAGSFLDRVVESFAGPHDYLSDMVGMYDQVGNGIARGGVSGLSYNAISFGLIPLAAPMSAAGLITTSPGLNSIAHEI